MSGPRRSSITIYDYPEHLNPFTDETANVQIRENGASKSSGKEGKHKFWTFGRSRKKRSHSFSIKSTWNGLFGKRKDAPEPAERRTTITTVSSTYQKGAFNERPVAPPRLSRDQQEFDEALGTLTRRRKYTFDESSRYGSNLTVNGDPARIYDGSPQDTTASIMSDLTPKPPARRFGQVSPRPKDKIPPLNYDDKDPKGNENNGDDREPDETPVPPKRFGQRSSQRLSASNHEPEDETFLRTEKSSDNSLRDENENVPEDYAFRRCSRDAVRRSNLSINSCVSIGSTASTFGRKKRRAPQPPRPKDQIEVTKDSETPLSVVSNDTEKVDLRITEPIDISRVTENIEEMTKKSQAMDDTSVSFPESGKNPDVIIKVSSAEDTGEESKEESLDKSKNEDSVGPERQEVPVDKIEIRREVEEKLEILKNIECPSDDDDVCLRKKGSSGTLSRSDSFSVKEEIEKIEKQIKALEAKNESRNLENDELATSRLSIQANRRSFFKNMVDDQRNGVKIEFKEYPREQKDISIVRLTEPPVPVDAPREPIKIVELHISEPIRRKPEIVGEVDINPLPKPQRRHSALDNLNSERSIGINNSRRSIEPDEMTSGKKGNSL